jgi:hypothetical protein
MKKLMLLSTTIFILSASCNGNQTANKEKTDAVLKATDSLTIEMDKLQSEIETKSNELDEALNALEPKK